MTSKLSELQELGEFVPELDARGRAEQALEEAERITRNAHRAMGIALDDYRRAQSAYADAKRTLETMSRGGHE
jgi:adenylate cyclase class IV